MKVIFLAGEPHCGKTTTMTRLYDLLTANMQVKPVKEELHKIIKGAAKKDFYCTITVEGKVIVIFTAGDTFLVILIAFLLHVHIKVDYLIIPFSYKGKQPEPRIFDLLPKLSLPHILLHKTVCEKTASDADKDAENENDCKAIIASIKKDTQP